MKVGTYKTIDEFISNHADAEVALLTWLHVAENSQWHSLNDIKNTFNSVDYVASNRFIFNIKGNHYRLVAIIIFASQNVYIRFIGTHAEYDKINCSNI